MRRLEFSAMQPSFLFLLNPSLADVFGTSIGWAPLDGNASSLSLGSRASDSGLMFLRLSNSPLAIPIPTQHYCPGPVVPACFPELCLNSVGFPTRRPSHFLRRSSLIPVLSCIHMLFLLPSHKFT
ncbi:hypothetical protein BJX70DRAFT_189775 [Aspergillus crustosus]